jgi:hypothetical protein
MVADMFCGIITVSFLSPKRYISEAFVSSTSFSVSLSAACLYALEMNVGPLL